MLCCENFRQQDGGDTFYVRVVYVYKRERKHATVNVVPFRQSIPRQFSILS